MPYRGGRGGGYFSKEQGLGITTACHYAIVHNFSPFESWEFDNTRLERGDHGFFNGTWLNCHLNGWKGEIMDFPTVHG